MRSLFVKAKRRAWVLGMNCRRWGEILWMRFKQFIKNVYIRLHLYEAVYFFFYLFHRYKPAQMDLENVAHNLRVLLQATPKQGIDSTRHGKLFHLKTPWEKILFTLRNTLLFGAPLKRVERIVYFTYITITLELNNPFDKKVLMFFLEKKIALLNRLLKRVETINGRRWDQTMIKLHIEAFHHNSLLQYEVIRNMHAAVRRQKEPEVIRDVKEALKKGLYPILITEGCSGAYWMRGTDRQVLGLFKPFDEEIHAPNNPVGAVLQGALGQRKTRWGCRVGEAAHHEVGAFLVDAFFGFGVVPRTYYAEFTHRTFYLTKEDRLSSFRRNKTKCGSFQEYVGGFIPLTAIFKEEKDRLPLVEFQLIVVLDVIIGNTDRNTGNILVGDEKLAAIDHGLCFPDQNSGLSYWYWELSAGKEPLIQPLIDLLDRFPFEALFWKLKKNCFISVNSLARMRERVVLFREAIHAGLVPKQLVELMKPEYFYHIKDYQDLLVEKAREQVELYKETLNA